MLKIGKNIVERIEEMVTEFANERSEILADHLESLLNAFAVEASRGATFHEGTKIAWQKAHQELCAYRGWGFDPNTVLKEKKND